MTSSSLPNTADPAWKDGLVLSAGSHDSPWLGIDFMEAVSIQAGESYSDDPKCASVFLAELGRGLNDALDDEHRQSLIPLIELVPGTRGDGNDWLREHMALDWLVQEWFPIWLDGVGVEEPDQATKGSLWITTAMDLRGSELADSVATAVAWEGTTPKSSDKIQGDAVELYRRMVTIEVQL